MDQLTQDLKKGNMQVLEVPFPALTAGSVLVRNHFSLISAGTEGKTVKDARLGYVAKARARQKEVKQVLNAIKVNGLAQTYRMVMNKLEAPSALGYSCAGEVIAVAPDVTAFQVGDRVACGGSGAVHAEVVAVPQNLCVPVPEGVALEEAAFSTLAAIAMQGVRQAELALGSNCVVIGLGLVGLLTAQLLEAAGIRAIGIDLSAAQVAQAQALGISLALEREQEDLEEVVDRFTRGIGADAVIITAGTTSLDPVELAGRLSRQRGRVVIVGNVPTGFSRATYYRKELDLRMSCSYGPGRYDPEYEEKGRDYPVGYVRWTENRNMQAFLDLAADGKIDVAPLITHTFPLASAPDAYQMILDRAEPFIGILLAYDVEKPLRRRFERPEAPRASETVRVGFIGAGSFAQNFLLPAVQGKANLVGVATARANSARNVADRYGFAYATGDAEEVIGDPGINTVFIATRHDLHAPLVLQAMAANKHVYTEKPLCMNEAELDEIVAAYAGRKLHLMVGFNRRFAPSLMKLRAAFSDDVPKAISYRINAGVVPRTHWVHDPEVGGGRIIGEACHFIDLARHIAGAPIVAVDAIAHEPTGASWDTVSILLQFADGSIANVGYYSNGNKQLPKEQIEVFSAGKVVQLEDFRTLTVYGKSVETEKMRSQDKGFEGEVGRFLEAIRSGKDTPIPFDEIENSMRATFATLTSIREQRKVRL